MCICAANRSIITSPQEIQEKITTCERKSRDMRITAFALGAISLCLFSLSFFLFGAGTLPATVTGGFGLLPYLGGVFFGFLGLGILCSAIVFVAIASVQSYQRQQWANTTA